MTNGFDLDHNLDLWIFKVKRDLHLWPHTWPWPWVFMVKCLNSCISEWEGWLTLHKGDGSRSFMTMAITIWWPRSGVWIYQIVTRVTSVVGVPSTHQVILIPVFKISMGITTSGLALGGFQITIWALSFLQFLIYIIDTYLKHGKNRMAVHYLHCSKLLRWGDLNSFHFEKLDSSGIPVYVKYICVYINNPSIDLSFIKWAISKTDNFRVFISVSIKKKKFICICYKGLCLNCVKQTYIIEHSLGWCFVHNII